MTEPLKPAAPRPGPTAAHLVAIVTSVEGVHAIEPGLGTAMRTLDARVRRTGAYTARFGLHIDTAEGTATVEVSLDRSRPVRETVRDIQLALRRALSDQSGGSGVGGSGVGGPPAGPVVQPDVAVRVQSLRR